MFKSLRAKIFLLFIAGLAAILVLLMVILSLEVYENYTTLYRQQAEASAEQLKFKTEKLFQLGLYPDELLGYEKLCEDILGDNAAFAYVALIDSEENPFYSAGLPVHEGEHHHDDSHEDQFFHRHTVSTPLQHPSGIDTSVVISIDHGYELQKVQELVLQMLFYGFWSSLAGMLVIMYFLRTQLVIPIGQLIEHIQGVDLEHTPPDSEITQRKDEIGFVARVFNRIMTRLANSQASYRKANKELQVLAGVLETRVEERTRELKEANERLDIIAKTDTLSGLGNRLQFLETFQQRFKHAQRHQHNFAVLMIDLDGFKQINDQYGHAAGDLVLKKIGQRLKSSFRGGDSAFRMGGDEFIILVEEYDNAADLKQFTQKVIDRILEPVIYEDTQLPLGVSIGVACLENYDEIEAHSFLSRSDVAMYKAKRAGGGFAYADEA